MGNAAFIVWRETIEAMLVIGILHGWLTGARDLSSDARRHALAWLWGGVGAGLLLAVLLALSLMGMAAWANDIWLERLQAAMPLLAAVLILHMLVWMRRHGGHLKRTLETELSSAAERAHWVGMAALAALAVGREGAETVIFLYGVAGDSAPAELLAGSALGFLLALAAYVLLVRGAMGVSWRTFFRVTEALLLLLGGALLVEGSDRLIGLDLLPPLVDPLWNAAFLLDDSTRTGGLVAAFTGWRAQPAGMSYLALAAWWGGAVVWVLRMRPAAGRQP